MADFCLALVLLWAFFTTGILIWNNPFSHDEVRKAEKGQRGPWPDEEKSNPSRVLACSSRGSSSNPKPPKVLPLKNVFGPPRDHNAPAASAPAPRPDHGKR